MSISIYVTYHNFCVILKFMLLKKAQIEHRPLPGFTKNVLPKKNPKHVFPKTVFPKIHDICIQNIIPVFPKTLSLPLIGRPY